MSTKQSPTRQCTVVKNERKVCSPFPWVHPMLKPACTAYHSAYANDQQPARTASTSS